MYVIETTTIIETRVLLKYTAATKSKIPPVMHKNWIVIRQDFTFFVCVKLIFSLCSPTSNYHTKNIVTLKKYVLRDPP